MSVSSSYCGVETSHALMRAFFLGIKVCTANVYVQVVNTDVLCTLDRMLIARLLTCRDALHGSEGPLCWLTQQLLGPGRRSPRILALTALHLSGLFLACPPVALLYQTEIQQLLLCDLKDSPSEVHS